MTSSLRPEDGSPPTQGQPVDPLAEWLAGSNPSPRPEFQAGLRSRVLDLPPSPGHWILRLPGRKPLYLPTLPTAMSLLVLGAALLAAGWMLLDGSRLITSSEQVPATVKPVEIVPATRIEPPQDNLDGADSEDVVDRDAPSSDDSGQDAADEVEDGANETTSDEEPGAPDAEQPGRLPTATAPPTEAPPATATTVPPPTATATEPPPPPPPPPPRGDDDDDDDDPPSATPEPPTATATWSPPAQPEPIPSATRMPTRDLPTTVPPTEIPPSPTPANP